MLSKFSKNVSKRDVRTSAKSLGRIGGSSGLKKMKASPSFKKNIPTTNVTVSRVHSPIYLPNYSPNYLPNYLPKYLPNHVPNFVPNYIPTHTTYSTDPSFLHASGGMPFFVLDLAFIVIIGVLWILTWSRR